MSMIYESSGWATHREYKRRSIARPIARDQSHMVITRFFRGPVSTYATVALNTPDTEFATAYLVSNGEQTFVDGDEVQYTCVYATVPSSSIPDWSSASVIYPGLVGERPPQPARTVTVKIVRQYALIGAGLTYTTPDAMPVTEQTTLQAGGWVIGGILSGNQITLDAFTIKTGSGDPTIEATSQAVGGFISDFMGIDAATTGAATAYAALITADETATSYSIVLEATKPVNYMGNIWMTETVYVKAR